MDRARTVKLLGFFAFLFVIEWILYFRHVSHFFQGDAIFLIDHRASSFGGYLREFIALNPSGWFRPLTNELVESVLFPFAGLRPAPYRIPIYVAFIAVTIAVYKLLFTLLRRHIAAGLGTFFFSIHTTNAYVTYDVGFLPELFYTFFYVCATVAFLRYIASSTRAAHGWSVVYFVLALLSKESAVTLPAALFLTSIVFGPANTSIRERFVKAMRAVAPHALILAIYLVYTIGYLHVEGISVARLLSRTPEPNADNYVVILNDQLFSNVRLAFAWAFNIPAGYWGQWQNLTFGMRTYLELFRIVAVALAGIVFIKGAHRFLVFGMAWFAITVLPPLVLVNHFVPHYLFLPIIGLSLVLGKAFALGFDWLRKFQPVIAATGVTLVFAGLLYANTRSIRGNIYDNRLLGGSARLALDTLNDLKRSYPILRPGTTLYFADEDDPLEWEHDFGRLIKLAYSVDDISILYQSQGDALSADAHGPLIFRVRNGHLIDETAFYQSNSSRLIRYVNSDARLTLTPSEVEAGQGRYTMRIEKLPDLPVQVGYTLNAGPLQVFTTVLDARGEVTFDVSSDAKPGVYRFWAFTMQNSGDWFRADQTLTVR
jgi:hypothetical protein